MAYGILPEPGKIVNGLEIGPCVKDCHHPDCKCTRDQAATKCYICGKEIGYETEFTKDNQSLVHYLCLIKKIDSE